jgi:hypothetical protein
MHDGGMSLPRQLRPSPPAGFPVYGLGEEWHGTRWLESFGDGIGDPVHWVSLGNRGPDGASLVFVETHSRARTDAMAARSGQPSLRHVTHRAAITLVNITLPAPSVPRPDGMLRALVDHADERSGGYAQWPPVSWLADGVTVTARTWGFAGGWAAVSDAVDDVYLAVVGVGTGPGGLPLSLIRDGSAYHFLLDQPLHPDVMAASRAARGGDELLEPRRGRWHDDQLRVLRDRA